MRLSHRMMLYTLFCVLLCSSSVIGQGTSGTISGTVMDPQGSRVPNATVIIKNLDIGSVREVVSNTNGYYRVAGLQPGRYEVRIESQGFSPEVRSGIKLTVAEEVVVNFDLKVSGAREELVVNVETVGVETTGSTLSGLVDEKKIRDLPLNGRDIAMLILLQPGVVNSRGSAQSANTGRGTRFSVGGARPSQNLFQVDGTTINDALNNTPGSAQGLLIGVETIKEFRVLTNTFSAEYGRSSGGVFVAITKSGLNDFRGSVFEFLRNDNLDARNFFDADRCEFRRNQFGSTLGGPIVENKTFFFGSYEGLREFKGIGNIAVVPDDNARRGILPGLAPIRIDPRAVPLLELFPRANGRLIIDPETGAPSGMAEFAGETGRFSRGDFFTIRGDHTFSASDSLFVRYLFDDSDQLLPRFFPDYPNQAANRKQVLTIGERKFIGSYIVNEVRFGFNRSTPAEMVPLPTSNVELIAGRGLGEVTVSGLTPVGTDRTSPKLFFQNNFQFTDNLFITQDRHNLKMGFSFDRFQFNGRSESRTRGRLRFRTLADLLNFRVRDLEGSSFNLDFVRGYRQSLFGFYFQDDFKLTPRLTLNLGVRYEFATSPTEVNSKSANLRSIFDPDVTIGEPLFESPKRGIAPRIGFAYDVFGDGKTALRGGFGIFYEQPLFSSYRSVAFGSLPLINSGRLTASQVTGLPVNPALFTSGTRLTESIVSDMRSIYTMQYNLNIQREILGTVMSLAYVGSRGVNLLGQGDINTAIPQILADGRAFFPEGSLRRHPRFDAVRSVIQGFNSWYNSLNVGAARRFNKGLQFQVSYTYGKSIDERSGTGGRSEFTNGQARTFDPYNRSLDHARSDFDVRHSFIANFTYDLPFGKNLKGYAGHILRNWQINSIVTLSSGVPFTVGVDGDVDRDGSEDNLARPNLLPNVSLIPAGGRTPEVWFNPLAFAPPDIGFRGTAGRNILNGPNFKTVDFSLVKVFPFQEGRSIQFRIEAFNLFNRANFDLPYNSDDGAQVLIYYPPVGNEAEYFLKRTNVGRIYSTIGDSRELQLGLKLVF
ncbi:MAG: TonB-dependent receptor [Acidobacteria bacterium]|nr:TonB-dependent receptor [Acidobacteriota bacterium]